jgi:hypothetical protein
MSIPGRFVKFPLTLFSLMVVIFFAQSMRAGELSIPDRIKADVAFLAADKLEGRDVGTPGGAEAANFIRERFRALGLKSGVTDGSYFQPFKIKIGSQVTDATFLEFIAPDGTVTKLTRGTDYQPLFFGGDGKFDAPVVFAGYGISSEDPAYDEFKNIEIEGKVVLLIRREPQQDDPNSPFNGTELSRHAELDTKIKHCWQHKAAAVLLVSDHRSTSKDESDPLLKPDYGPGTASVGVPVCHLTRAWGDKLLAGTAIGNLAAAEKKIDESLQPQSIPLEGWKVRGNFEFVRTQVETPNVIGVLEGEGPLADETIIIGAHYDHIGMGGPNSRNPNLNAIHNGADDNASGTAALLELARRFAERGEKPKRKLVFIAFSGEERGLLGSAHYVKRDPVVPLDKTVMMVNFDMVGRLRQERLIVYGTKTAEGLEEIITKLDEKYDALRISQVPLGVPASDHITFYRQDIPSLHLFTGTHPEYHMPTDDVETLNYPGMEAVVSFAENLIDDFIAMPERPKFTKVEEKDPHAGMQLSTKGDVPYLGTSPDYGDEVDGVLLNGVREGSPADKGGLKSGDIIIELDGQAIKNVRQYTTVLYAHKPGDQVKIVVLRGDEKTTLDVTLGKRGETEKQ